jgi:hypothetical protein
VKHAFAVHGESDRVKMMAGLLAEHGCPHPAAPVEGQAFTFD